MVEQLVWMRIQACAGQIALATEGRVEAELATTYRSADGMWFVAAATSAPPLALGLWQVSEADGKVTPVDEVARQVDSPGLVCELPKASIAGGNTPPVFATPAPATPVASPTPEPLTGDQARLRVWVAVRSCFNPIPPIGSFTAYRDSSGRWIVEGREETTSSQGSTALITYGLWAVDVSNGDVIPYDPIALATAGRTNCYKAP